MRTKNILLVLICFVAFPGYLFALESSSSGSAPNSATTAASSESSSQTGKPSISTITDDRQSPTREATKRPDQHEPIQQEITINRNSSFQAYVLKSTGSSLGVFGRELFGNVPSTYAPLGAVQVNSDYVIGPGDDLQIRGWGMVDINLNVTVSRSGEIYLPRIGSVQVAGVKYRDLQGYLKKAIGRIFTNFELSVAIVKTRSVQIYIVGHAERPGTYTLSAMSTLLNALFASGGPSVTGSMRNIKLKRGTGPLVSFDLYDILLSGDTSKDTALQDGDVIYIPPVGPLVALFGDVKKPAIYELQQKTSIAEIVRWAGGFESAANLKKVIIEKNIDKRYQTLAEIESDWASIETNLAQLEVQPTDIIRVFAPGAVAFQLKAERAFVGVDGPVIQSGVYQLEKGETLKALITRIGGVTSNGYIYGTRLNRESVRREQQAQIDNTVDRFEKDLDANYRERIAREADPEKSAIILKQVEFQRSLLAKLRAFKADGRIILGLKEFDSKVTDLPDFPLEDGDRIFIPQKSTTVSVLGSVYQQNTFIYKPDYSVNDYIEKAGGVNPSADKSMVFRICADGTLQSKKHGGWTGSINPGDAIVVPEKIIKIDGFGTSFMTALKDWTTILYQFGLAAVGFKTLQN
jgi:polysaccharide biosynthesis/export protein